MQTRMPSGVTYVSTPTVNQLGQQVSFRKLLGKQGTISDPILIRPELSHNESCLHHRPPNRASIHGHSTWLPYPHPSDSLLLSHSLVWYKSIPFSVWPGDSLLLILFCIIYLFGICVHTHCTCCVQVRGKLAGVRPLLPLCGTLGKNSGWQPLVVKQTCHFLFCFI